MEWVEVTAKSVESAKELALDRLGISVDDAEFDVVEEPRSGLFGRIRGEARVRARVKPTMVRQKHERRSRRSGEGGRPSTQTRATEVRAEPANELPAADTSTGTIGDGDDRRRRRPRNPRERSPAAAELAANGDPQQGGAMEEREDDTAEAVAVEDVQTAAEEFARGLVGAFGLQATTSSVVEGNEIEVRVDSAGDGLGLLIGPSGRTLLAIQDLARVAAQRRLGDHDTRLRVDVAGYREKRRSALERFAREVAELVKQSGVARSLEPMPSSDRKVIHDTLTTIDGVASRSEGEDPYRRIIVSPA
jgi:spoIIIJ-associated protein